MVKITYGKQKQQANLTGKSLAEVRQLYKAELGLPDRAKIRLNDRPIKKDLEAGTRLCEGDKLSFVGGSSRGLVLLGTFLATLVITAGLYAFAYITTSATITVTTGSADYASISTNATPSGYTLLGRHRGSIGAATLFDVTRTTGYTGDLEIQISLANADELSSDYSFWMLRLELQDIAGTPVDAEGITQVLSLDNPMVSFAVDNWTASTRYVKVLGGSYRVLPFVLGLAGNDPLIFGQVVQAGP